MILYVTLMYFVVLIIMLGYKVVKRRASHEGIQMKEALINFILEQGFSLIMNILQTIVISCLTLSSSGNSISNDEKWVNAEIKVYTAVLRMEDSIDSKREGELKKGEEIEVIISEEQFLKIRYKYYKDLKKEAWTDRDNIDIDK